MPNSNYFYAQPAPPTASYGLHTWQIFKYAATHLRVLYLTGYMHMRWKDALWIINKTASTSISSSALRRKTIALSLYHMQTKRKAPGSQYVPFTEVEVHYRVHNSLTPVHINPVHILPPYFSKIHFNVIFPYTHRYQERCLRFKLHNKVVLIARCVLHAPPIQSFLILLP
jgi:hypothetical protein